VSDHHGRKKHVWRAQIQRENGEIVEREVSCLWDPEKDYTTHAVAESAAALEAVEYPKRGPQGQIMRHSGLSAVLVS
jgi:hypothetical protein